MGKAKKQSSQATPEVLTPLLEPLAALQRILNQFKNRGLIIGGIAASLLGQPRLSPVILTLTKPGFNFG
jgi:hypothetical protein